MDGFGLEFLEEVLFSIYDLYLSFYWFFLCTAGRDLAKGEC